MNFTEFLDLENKKIHKATQKQLDFITEHRTYPTYFLVTLTKEEARDIISDIVYELNMEDIKTDMELWR